MLDLRNVETMELRLTPATEKLVDEYGERDDHRAGRPIETLDGEPLVLPRKRRPAQ
jgi:hypothetical protein